MGKKTFNLTKTIKTTFDLIVDGLTTTASWIITISQTSLISFAIKMQQFISVNFSNKMQTVFSMKFTEYPSLTASTTISLATVFSQSQSLTITKTASFASDFVLGQQIRGSTTITGFNFSTSFVPILAQFYSLGDWDSSTLGSMDSQTLGDLDYVVV